MRRTELALEQIEDVNGGMYQGYDGIERPWINRYGTMLTPKEQQKFLEFLEAAKKIPERKVPPHGGMGTGMMGPGMNYYQY